MIHPTMKTSMDLRDILVVAPSLHRHYSGVTSTIISLIPHQTKYLPIATIGPYIPTDIPKISIKQLFLYGWCKPKGKSYRIWHARRNNEMVLGIFFKKILRQPWKLIFTRAALRKPACFTSWMLRKMDAVIATSDAAASYLNVPATVIHHGIDTERFHPLEDNVSKWAESGLPGRFGIGVFGRIRPEKGTDLFIEAMIVLLPKYPNFTAIITGFISAEYQKFALQLKKRISEAGFDERIIFLGEKTVKEMPKLFRQISLYVAPMRWEGFGLTPLEAMASGAAVVATQTGAAPKLIIDGETGILVPPNDLNALIRAIDTLLANPEKMNAMGKAGRENVVRYHDIDNEAKAICEVYEKVWDFK